MVQGSLEGGVQGDVKREFHLDAQGELQPLSGAHFGLNVQNRHFTGGACHLFV